MSLTLGLLVCKHLCTVPAGVQFFRQFLGLFGNGFPEVMVNNRPKTYFESTRIHATRDCQAVAMSFKDANCTLSPSASFSGPPGGPGGGPGGGPDGGGPPDDPPGGGPGGGPDGGPGGGPGSGPGGGPGGVPPGPGSIPFGSSREETSIFLLQNSTFWYSKAPQDPSLQRVVISAAEESLREKWKLLRAYGADRSSNNTSYYSEFGYLPENGSLQMTKPSKKGTSAALEGDEGDEEGPGGDRRGWRGPPPDYGIPCILRDQLELPNPEDLPGGLVIVANDGSKQFIARGENEEGMQLAREGGGWGPFGFVRGLPGSDDDEFGDGASEEDGPPLGVIYGAVIAAAVLTIFLTVLALLLIRRRRRRAQKGQYQNHGKGSDIGSVYGPHFKGGYGPHAGGVEAQYSGSMGNTETPNAHSQDSTLDAMSASNDRSSSPTASRTGSHDHAKVGVFHFLSVFVSFCHRFCYALHILSGRTKHCKGSTNLNSPKGSSPKGCIPILMHIAQSLAKLFMW